MLAILCGTVDPGQLSYRIWLITVVCLVHPVTLLLWHAAAAAAVLQVGLPVSCRTE
jgi:hypothetical protein